MSEKQNPSESQSHSNVSESAEPEHAEHRHNGVADFALSLIKSSIEDPINGTSQFVNHSLDLHIPALELVSELDDNMWTKAGAVVGNAIDVAGLSYLTGGSSSVGALALRSGAAGALFSLSRPIDDSRNYWENKATGLAVGFASFATIGGMAGALGRSSLLGAVERQTIAQSMTIGSLSGVSGGVVSAESESILRHGTLASPSEVGLRAMQYGLYGATASGINFATGALHPSTEISTTSANTALESEEPDFSLGPGRHVYDFMEKPGYSPIRGNYPAGRLGIMEQAARNVFGDGGLIGQAAKDVFGDSPF